MITHFNHVRLFDIVLLNVFCWGGAGLPYIQPDNPETRRDYAQTLSRGVNRRELQGFFGHSSESSGWIFATIGGNCSYRPPGAF